MQADEPGPRELFDGEFVTVLLEGVQPITVLGIPRAAVLSDQQGDYVYVVDAAEQSADPPHSARPIDPDHRGGDKRAQGRRAGDQRGACSACAPARRYRPARRPRAPPVRRGSAARRAPSEAAKPATGAPGAKQ